MTMSSFDVQAENAQSIHAASCSYGMYPSCAIPATIGRKKEAVETAENLRPQDLRFDLKNDHFHELVFEE